MAGRGTGALCVLQRLQLPYMHAYIHACAFYIDICVCLYVCERAITDGALLLHVGGGYDISLFPDTHIYIYTYVYIHIYIYIRVHDIDMHANTSIYIYKYICIYIYIFIHLFCIGRAGSSKDACAKRGFRI